MAIAFVSLTGAANGSGTATTSIAISKPTGLVDGIVVLLGIATNNGTATGGSQAKNTDSTWTRLQTGEDAATANVGLSVFRRVVTTASSEPASYAFSFVQFSDDTTSQSVSYGWTLTGFSGVDNTTPEDVTTPASLATTTPGSLTTNIPAITTVSANAMIVGLAGVDITSATWTAPSGFSNLTSQVTGRSTASASKILASVGTNAQTSFTNSTSAGGPGVGITVALRPAGAVAARQQTFALLGVGV